MARGYWVTATGLAAHQCALSVEQIPVVQRELNMMGEHQLEFAIDQGVGAVL